MWRSIVGTSCETDFVWSVGGHADFLCFRFQRSQKIFFLVAQDGYSAKDEYSFREIVCSYFQDNLYMKIMIWSSRRSQKKEFM